MKKCSFLTLVGLFICCIIGSKAHRYADVDMISDVIASLDRPTAVVSAVCWSSKKIKVLARALSSNSKNVSVSFTNLTDKLTDLPAQPDEYVLFLADASCVGSRDYFIKKSAASHFRSPFRWLIIDPTLDSAKPRGVPDPVKQINIYPDGEVIVAVPTSNVSFLLRRNVVYRHSSGSPWLTEEYGIWATGMKFRVASAIEPMAMRRLDLNGTALTLCYVITNNNTIHHLSDLQDGHIDTITKANFPLSNHLMDFLRAKRVSMFTDTWGYPVNGSYNGMLGHLIRGDAVIGGTPLFLTPERIPIVDYIACPITTLSKFVFRQPKLSYVNNIFLLPFRNTVWYCSIALLLIELLSLFLVTIWEGRKFANSTQRKNDAGVLRPKLSDVALLTFGAACQQGTSVQLKGSLGRVVILVLFLSFMFLYTSYSANIVALLQSSSSYIKTLEDLLHSRLRFAVDDTVFNRYYFSTATEPVRKAIYETKIAPPGTKPRFITMEEGVKNIRQGLFAFHMETGVGYNFVGKYFKEEEKCGLKEIQFLQVNDPWLAVKKNNPYREMMRIGMRRIQEFGLQDREKSLLYAKKPRCAGLGNSFVSVTMVDCYPALLVFTYGIACSLIILVMERLAMRKQAMVKLFRRNEYLE